MHKTSAIGMALAVTLPTIILWLAGALPGSTALLLLTIFGVLTALSFFIADTLTKAITKEKH